MDCCGEVKMATVFGYTCIYHRNPHKEEKQSVKPLSDVAGDLNVV